MYLLDTNVLSETRRLESLSLRKLATSPVCAMELRIGAVQSSDGEALWARIRSELLSRVRVLRFGLAEAQRAADLLVDLESRGERVGLEDVITALEHRLVVVTRNVRHFGRIPGLKVESWFT